jgi:hypothetical protein
LGIFDLTYVNFFLVPFSKLHFYNFKLYLRNVFWHSSGIEHFFPQLLKNNNWKENFYESPEVSRGDGICREWNAKTFCSISKLIQLLSHVIVWAWTYFAIWTNLLNEMCSNVDIFALTLFHLSVNLIFKIIFGTFFRQKFWILMKMKWKGKCLKEK